MGGSIRLGKLMGIDVSAQFSWFIILALLTWSLASNWFPQFFAGWSTLTYWLVAFTATLLFAFCILLHELAHALVARAYGQAVRGITLFIFGGVADVEQEVKRPGVELQIALAGPLASFLLAGIAFLLTLPLKGNSTVSEAVLDYLVITNLLVGGFNLIPAFPLDGGRVLQAIIWKVTGNLTRSAGISSFIGQGFGYVLMVFGIVNLLAGSFFNGLWIAFIGWFLVRAARAARMRIVLQSTLAGIRVAEVMDTHPVTIPANISIQKAVDTYLLPLGLSSALVVQGDLFAGMLSLMDIGHLDRESWAKTPVGYVMRLPEKLCVATPNQLFSEILDVIVAQDVQDVPVLDGQRLVGLVNRESILTQLNKRPVTTTDGLQRTE
jgi:Zn-dependent protease/predicted transcriptional regulator